LNNKSHLPFHVYCQQLTHLSHIKHFFDIKLHSANKYILNHFLFFDLFYKIDFSNFNNSNLSRILNNFHRRNHCHTQFISVDTGKQMFLNTVDRLWAGVERSYFTVDRLWAAKKEVTLQLTVYGQAKKLL